MPEARAKVAAATDAVSKVLWGNRDAVRIILAAVMARGHVLIEDVPGVGKTTLARAVAKVLGCSFSRIQFTADMLPADLLGVHVLEPKKGEFVFKKGPIFAHVVLADEINRASPKTQSAMLEAMSDKQVTVDESSFPLPAVFTVLATQNPVEHHGAYPLPESQLDRFMAHLTLGYPPAADEKALVLSPQAPEQNLQAMPVILGAAEVAAIQTLVARVPMHDSVATYLLALVDGTRHHRDVALGCSPRGAIEWAALSRAAAFIDGRDFVLPDDVKALARPVLVHRLVIAGAGGQRELARQVVAELLERTPVPR
ncbi:MAG: MoxR family ATPase [Deltaproteobacteria bacterium]|nr:MoxR family ATPase [Deltaproteobacteria bacterium]